MESIIIFIYFRIAFITHELISMNSFIDDDKDWAKSEREFVEEEIEYIDHDMMLAEEEINIIEERDYDELVHDDKKAFNYMHEQECLNISLGDESSFGPKRESSIPSIGSNDSLPYVMPPSFNDIFVRSLCELKSHVIAETTKAKNDIMGSINELKTSMDVIAELHVESKRKYHQYKTSYDVMEEVDMEKERKSQASRRLFLKSLKPSSDSTIKNTSISPVQNASPSRKSSIHKKNKVKSITPVKRYDIGKWKKTSRNAIAKKDDDQTLVNSLGFYSLEYNNNNENAVTIYLPQISDWFRKCISSVDKKREPTNMPDCMCQILAVLANVKTNDSCLEVVPFLVSIDYEMTREDVCQTMQEYSFMISDMSCRSRENSYRSIFRKNIGLAMFQVKGSFCCALFHMGTYLRGSYYSTLVILSDDKEEVRHYSVEGIADYFKVRFGRSQESFTWITKYVEYQDMNFDTKAFYPFTFKSFRKTNLDMDGASHMMTLKFVITFVSYFDRSTLFPDALSKIQDCSKHYGRFDPETKLKLELYTLCYKSAAYAINKGLFKVSRLPCGEAYIGNASDVASAFDRDLIKSIEKVVMEKKVEKGKNIFLSEMNVFIKCTLIDLTCYC